MSPVIRPMFYDFPENKKCWDIEDQYMFGPDILVVPIFMRYSAQEHFICRREDGKT